jgi:hypothetical protein
MAMFSVGFNINMHVLILMRELIFASLVLVEYVQMFI